jgi:hypothetical protein
MLAIVARSDVALTVAIAFSTCKFKMPKPPKTQRPVCGCLFAETCDGQAETDGSTRDSLLNTSRVIGGRTYRFVCLGRPSVAGRQFHSRLRSSGQDAC